MRCTRWIGVGLLLMGMALIPSSAQQESPPAVPSSPVSGILIELDAETGLLTLRRARAGDVQLYTTEDTDVLIADEVGQLKDLTVGQRLEVSVRAGEANRWTARWIRDHQTMAIREVESRGTPATILIIDAKEQQVMVRTQGGRQRTLVIRPEGRLASRIMKDGRPASLEAFAPQEQVWVSLRRTSGQALHLKGLADEATFLSFLLHSTSGGALARLNEEERQFDLALEEGVIQPVRWTSRTQVFLDGASTAAESLTNDLRLYVVERERSKGVITARALFDERSWRVYAQAVKEALEQADDPPPATETAS